MDVAAVMSSEIKRRETEFSAKGGDKLLNLMRPTLYAPDCSVSGNAHKKLKTNISVMGNALLCTCSGETGTGVSGGNQISGIDLNSPSGWNTHKKALPWKLHP